MPTKLDIIEIGHNMLFTRRAALKLAAPALILPSRQALAWRSAALTPSALIPSFAAAYGITQTLLSEDFSSISTIDVNNTLAPGFNWYLNNIPKWQGNNSPGWAPATTPGCYTVANSVMNITNNLSTASDGAEFASCGYISNTAPQMVNTIPLINGAKPFYIEGNLKLSANQYAAFWMQDQSSILRSINNTGNSDLLSEIDMIESLYGQHIQGWTSPTSRTTYLGSSVSWNTALFNTWGALVVPMAYNSGTGIAQLYINRVASQSALTWSGGDTYGIEASQYMIFFSIDAPVTDPFDLDYIMVWVHP